MMVSSPAPVYVPVAKLEGVPMEESEPIVSEVVVNGKPIFKNIFKNRKKASIRARERKIRVNRTLRKVLVPKNALMALNEVKNINVSDFVLTNNPQGGFIATVTVNSNEYEGKGISKAAAKNSACEKALRDFIITKMRQKPRFGKKPLPADEEAMDASDEEDDVPMVNLASFAIFKLFGEWENEGFQIPELHPESINGEPDGEVVPAPAKEPKVPKIRNELPANWETTNPSLLLSQMRPGCSFNNLPAVGEPPNAIQGVTITVDEIEYTGYGRSKKMARHNAAVIVLNTLFNTNFDQVEPYEVPDV